MHIECFPIKLFERLSVGAIVYTTMEDMQQNHCKKRRRYEIIELLPSGCHGIAIVDQGCCCSPGRTLGEVSERPAGSLLEWRSLYGRQDGWREPHPTRQRRRIHFSPAPIHTQRCALVFDRRRESAYSCRLCRQRSGEIRLIEHLHVHV